MIVSGEEGALLIRIIFPFILPIGIELICMEAVVDAPGVMIDVDILGNKSM